MAAFAKFVGVVGFEPTTPCSQSRYANRTALHPELCFLFMTLPLKRDTLTGLPARPQFSGSPRTILDCFFCKRSQRYKFLVI
jgi:hypothetical protein